MILGLTGGIASGKSFVSKIFLDLQVPIYDADIISKDIFNLSETNLEIKEKFGNAILNNGVVDRKLLKELVFSDGVKLKELNKIIHPKVINFFQNIKNKIIECKTIEDPLVIFDIPLLFESNLEYLCDKVLLVYLDEKLQMERLIKRDNISINLAQKIITAQMPLKDKIKRADFIIDNNGNIEELRIKVIEIFEKLKHIEKGII
jgi:dephospho-CoA kinase